MTGEELRAKRNELKLYQGHMAEQLQALGLELPGGLKIDQPAISQMERGRIPIPAEVAAAIAGGQVSAGNDAPPPVGQPRPAAGGERRGRRRVTKKQTAAAGDGAAEPPPPPAAAAAPPPSSDEQRNARAQAAAAGAIAPDDEPPAPPQGDRPPAPQPPPGPRATWDDAARSQLESDLRDLFAGQHFLVPMRLQRPDGEHEIVMQDAFLPGVAQLAGAVGGHDDERLIQLHAASMAHAWAELANENPGVRRWLMGMTYGGAWRGVIAATLPVVLGLAGNHGVGLPSFLGGPQTAGVALEP